jgi:hypothetical protein
MEAATSKKADRPDRVFELLAAQRASRSQALPAEQVCRCGMRHRALICPVCKTDSPTYARLKARTERRS